MLFRSALSHVWEQRKLGEVGTTFTGLSGKKASDFGHGKASLITYMNVFSNPIANPNMIENVEVDSRQREVEVGDVFFTTSSETPEEVGMSSVLKKKIGITYLNSFCFGFRPSVKFDLDYLAFMLRSESVRKQIKLLAQGISRFNIAKTKMMYIDIQVPKIDEQIAIGKYFAQLDRLITLHQCNCNMATRPCEWSSGLRAIAWEQRKLGEIADIVGGGTPSTNNPSYWNGDIDWYAPAEIGEQIFLTGSQKKITVLGLQKSSATILPVGSVLFTSRAGIGNTAILAKQGATNQGFQSIVPDSQITDSYFIFSRTHELKKYAEIVGAGSTFTEVSGKQMARMPILMPKIDEQVCIGTFFRNLDRLITLHQRKHILLT